MTITDRTVRVTRAGITARITDRPDGSVAVRCQGCGTALVDDDRGPFYDAAGEGAPHACPDLTDLEGDEVNGTSFAGTPVTGRLETWDRHDAVLVEVDGRRITVPSASVWAVE
jgi:hypothetical protein